jgi:radical SAM protein with 4Fe4S-binding SPASM domain
MTQKEFPMLKKPPYPLFVAWLSTMNCNLKCIHCCTQTIWDAKEKTLTIEEFKTLITEFASLGVKGIFLSGGEPLLKEDLLETIKFSQEEGISVFICTNATLMSEKRGRELKEAGLKGVYVGVEGTNADAQDIFYGAPGTFERKIEGIRGSVKAGLHTGIDFCCTAYNYHELENVISLARQLGANEFSLRRFVPVGRGKELKENLWMDPEIYREVITSYCNHILHPDRMKFMSLDPLVTARLSEMKPLTFYASPCNIGIWSSLTHNGDVIPCPYMPLVLGNVREESFKDIWKNSSVVEDLRDVSKLKGCCGTCELRYNCGGCRASAYSLTGDYHAEDRNCWKVEQSEKEKCR